ncbi:hypothetical protein Mpop_5453 (plasmid) [Methylorubrum populi BJ001]|uniref:Uncharacterized protein n=1 Tax=Methylorubrum populi (strain ATCC BAA-705 / NCIMB 13946 / BJ001) TaxID=441620 RepID=B1ZM69_METPB|nr:hypothetical protein [Methylorubrum populi]ACB83542.1 hypothetical protein Mpop_5453 [Methylorubrum populi BJ001]
MIQAQNIRLPGPIYSQLKALAVARATTMVEVVASFLRQAVEAGEIGAETSGLSIALFLDLDAADEADQGPFAIIKTDHGDMPPMARDDAEAVAKHLALEDDSRAACYNRFGSWSTERRGTSVKLTGTSRADDKAVTITMAPIVAKGLAAQLRKVAHELIAEANVE